MTERLSKRDVVRRAAPVILAFVAAVEAQQAEKQQPKDAA
jgi:hypothetical protein